MNNHRRETRTRCQGFLGCMIYRCRLISTMMAHSLFGKTILLNCLSSTYLMFLGWVVNIIIIFASPLLLGYRGYLSTSQSVLQTLLLFAKSLMSVCVMIMRKQKSPKPTFPFPKCQFACFSSRITPNKHTKKRKDKRTKTHGRSGVCHRSLFWR